MSREYKLPNLGEGIDAGDVVRVLVSDGDQIEVEQTILELETDKAMLEVPCPYPGRVEKVHVKEGDRVPVGALLLTLDETTAEAEAPKSEEPIEKPSEAVPSEPEPFTEPQSETPPSVPHDKKPSPPSAVPEPREVAPAGPATRRLARELGVDLGKVTGSESGGRVTAEDVHAYVKKAMSGGTMGRATPSGGEESPPVDFEKWGEVERQPFRGVRRKTAEHVGTAWRLAPHVTQFDRADVTELEALRKRHAEEALGLGGKLTPTVFVLKAAVTALKAFPRFNASLDTSTEELVVKHYYHIGIAVDTDRGLLVPVIRDVDRKGIFELARELVELSERTRQGKVDVEELKGGTFTITNLGSIGGTAFTPIVNHPEVGILGLSRSRLEPVVRNGRVEPRLMMPICLSYDHRVIDGADGARFARKIAESLEGPEKLLMGG